MCEVCGSLMQRLRAFESVENSTQNSTTEWAGVSGRLESRFEKYLHCQTKPVERGERPRLRQILWSQILAYAAILALIYPAWLGISASRTSRNTMTEIESAYPIRLDATRSGKLSASAVSGGTGVPTLTFFVPVRDGFRYRACDPRQRWQGL